jgi:hypothetical protein
MPGRAFLPTLFALGDTGPRFALKLGMSVFTARNHVSVILAILGCSDRLELIARYRSFNPAPEKMHKHRVVAPMANAPTVGERAVPKRPGIVIRRMCPWSP